MTLYEFQIKELSDQLDHLRKEGTYIGKRRLNDLILLLYQCDGFYVELYYIKYRLQVAQVRCFKSTFRLDPYLPETLLGDLV
ncbi:MAG TPA: hypothetical protein VEY06_12125 [Flavisolibacter sp.]|jgi:hypothetical protein|nr:hypothetical protein [Flavisolibacter sp.]